MADKRLRVILELVGRGLQTGLGGIRGAIQRVTGGLSDMAKRGGNFVTSLSKHFFFLASSMRMVAGLAKSLFDRFIQGAGDALKLGVKLKSLTGSADAASRVMDYMQQVALDTGKSFDSLAEGASLLAVAAKDSSGAFDFQKFTTLNNLLLRMSAYRPDVPIARLARGLQIFATTGELRSLEMFLDIPIRQLAGIEEKAQDVAKVPEEVGRAVTYIETGVKDAGDEATMSLQNLDDILTKAGISMQMVQDVAELSGMERFNETLGQIARTIGEPLFEVLNEQMSELADWLQENPELVERLAKALGNLGATGIEALFEAIVRLIESIDFEKLASDAEKFINALASGDAQALPSVLDDIVSSLGKIGNFFEKVEGLGTKLGLFGEEGGMVPEPSGILKAKGEGYSIGTHREPGSMAVFDPQIVEPIKKWFSDFLATEEKKAAAFGIKIDLSLNNEMLDAQIRQTSGDVVVESFNEVTQNLGEH